jgi:hypothetical protein
MLSTVIRDSYRESEAQQIADALEELCSPEDNYGWASAGIYCFWSIETRQPLYVGLAVDLGSRFQQHNGLKPCAPNACKVEQIRQHFREHEFLGYSVLVQTPLDQPMIARNKIEITEKSHPDLKESIELVEAGRDRIVLAEGAIIEACMKQLGVRPPWNKIGGSLEGQERSVIEHYDFVKWMVAQEHPPFVARFTLRQIAANPEQEGFEEDLHAARMRMMMNGISFDRALEWLPTVGEIQAARVNNMRTSGYLTGKVPFER